MLNESTVQAHNLGARFLPADPTDPETLPCIEVAGVQVYAYVHPEHGLTVSVHTDGDTASDLTADGGDQVAMRMTVNGDSVHETAQSRDSGSRAGVPAEPMPRRFHLLREFDATGASGTGRVADGVEWPDGTATVHWRGEDNSDAFWPTGMAGVQRRSCHDGHTLIIWDDPPCGRSTIPDGRTIDSDAGGQ